MRLMRYRPKNAPPDDQRLGRYIPDSWDHIQKHPFRFSQVEVDPLGIDNVERILQLPYWHRNHDQGREGSCVGHGIAIERAIANTAQNKLLNIAGVKSRRYDPIHVWNEAKAVDEWDETNPGDDNGTSVNAGYKIVRLQGLMRVRTMKMRENSTPYPIGAKPVNFDEGISEVVWARNADEMRVAISTRRSICIGINWYRSFSRPEQISNGEYWIGRGDLGPLLGGHALCVYGASDRREAFKLKNSWGSNYPLVWLPYKVMDRMLHEWGEAALVIDR